MKKIVWLMQAAVFYIFTWVVSTIPESSRLSVGRRVGMLIAFLLPKRRAIAIDNIQKAMPYMTRHPLWTGEFTTAEEIARQMFANLGQSLVETCYLYHGKSFDIIDSIEVRDRDFYEKALLLDRGILFVNGHCGNWELLPFCFKKIFGATMSVVARRQNNPYLNTMVEKMRMGSENVVIYKQGALRPILASIKKKGIIGMLADQAVFEDEGVLIEFLGRKAWASKAPIIIARKTGVPLIPVAIHREGERHIVTFQDEFTLSHDLTDASIQSDVQGLSRYLENFICAHPADWYWVHRRWKRAGEVVDVA